MIQEELTKLADEADDEEDVEGDMEKDETKPAGQKVKAWLSTVHDHMELV